MHIRDPHTAFRAIALLTYARGLSLSRIYPILWHKLWPLHSSTLLHWLFSRSSDFLMSSRFPIQRNSNLFYWSCVSTLQSLQQCLFPPVFFWWWRETPLFRRWEESRFMFLLLHHAASRAHRSCLPETDPQILECLGCPDEVLLGKIILNDGFWSLLLAWRNTTLVSRTHRIGFDMSELFRKIDEDFGGSMTWNTRSNCRVSFNVVPLHCCCHSF